jgi:threonine synthase
VIQLVCHDCQRQQAMDAVSWRCTCGGLFDLDPKSAPVDLGDLTMGEGGTEVVRLSPRWPNLFVKVEYASPTLSFKDRGAVVVVAAARQVGARHLVSDSSGNAGTALAAYAARAGLPCTVFVPAATAPKKVVQMRRHGAEVVTIEGDRGAAAAAAQASVDENGWFYASHVYQPVFFEGTKHFALELAGLKPDAVVLPCGNGTLVLGAQLGFAELGWSDTKLIAVRADARPTVAEGIAIDDPPRWAQICEAADEIVSIDEDAIGVTADVLAAHGFFVEPTAAAPVVEAVRYAEAKPDEVVVVPLCGSGLKAF